MAVENPGQWDLPGEGPAGSEGQLLLVVMSCQPGHAGRPGQLVAAVVDCDHLGFID